MKNQCSGLAGLLFGHNYQSRFNREPGYLRLDGFSGPAYALKEVIEKGTKTIYVGDVCRRCGEIVNRKVP